MLQQLLVLIFGAPSVEKAVAGVTKTIAKLEAVAQYHQANADLQQQIADAAVKAERDSRLERDAALKTVSKFRALVG